jgi:rhodanese-related sulfurtransferase
MRKLMIFKRASWRLFYKSIVLTWLAWFASALLIGCSTTAMSNNKENDVNSGNAKKPTIAIEKVYEIEPKALAERIKQGKPLRIIDVREPEEVQEQPFIGAENIPLDTLPQYLKELSPQEEIIFVCRSGRRSALAVKYLIQEGLIMLKLSKVELAHGLTRVSRS